MPIFSITRRDPPFTDIVHATIRSYPAVSNPQPTSAAAPSVANPCPQNFRRRRYPISASASLSGNRQNHPTKSSSTVRRAVQT